MSNGQYGKVRARRKPVRTGTVRIYTDRYGSLQFSTAWYRLPLGPNLSVNHVVVHRWSTSHAVTFASTECRCGHFSSGGLGVAKAVCSHAVRPAGPGRGVPTGRKARKRVRNSSSVTINGMGPTHQGTPPRYPPMDYPPMDYPLGPSWTTLGTPCGLPLPVDPAPFWPDMLDLACPWIDGYWWIIDHSVNNCPGSGGRNPRFDGQPCSTSVYCLLYALFLTLRPAATWLFGHVNR